MVNDAIDKKDIREILGKKEVVKRASSFLEKKENFLKELFYGLSLIKHLKKVKKDDKKYIKKLVLKTEKEKEWEINALHEKAKKWLLEEYEDDTDAIKKSFEELKISEECIRSLFENTIQAIKQNIDPEKDFEKWKAYYLDLDERSSWEKIWDKINRLKIRWNKDNINNLCDYLDINTQELYTLLNLNNNVEEENIELND